MEISKTSPVSFAIILISFQVFEDDQFKQMNRERIARLTATVKVEPIQYNNLGSSLTEYEEITNKLHPNSYKSITNSTLKKLERVANIYPKYSTTRDVEINSKFIILLLNADQFQKKVGHCQR
jgi:hypothetical protein